MKKLMMLLAFAGLMAGCARHTETSQGAGGYDNGGTMGTSTYSTQGGTSDQGTAPRGTGTDTGDTTK